MDIEGYKSLQGRGFALNFITALGTHYTVFLVGYFSREFTMLSDVSFKNTLYRGLDKYLRADSLDTRQIAQAPRQAALTIHLEVSYI